jgi:RNA polymerase sigma-70 factor (ECF subfamily)
MAITEKTAAEFIEGNIDALKTIYETTKRSIYSAVYRLTGDHHDTEDILHDVYIRAYEKRALYKKEKAGLHTWIYKLAVNYTLNMLKKKNRWDDTVVVEEVKEGLMEPEHDRDAEELALQVLDKIHPDFRTCLVLRELEDRSYEEIAQILEISPGTVRSRINRGRQQLKKLFHEHDGR